MGLYDRDYMRVDRFQSVPCTQECTNSLITPRTPRLSFLSRVAKLLGLPKRREHGRTDTEQVEQILAKIRDTGIDSLSRRERKTLTAASRRYQKEHRS